ncbi:MAG: PPC domain-containing DNA-binding protein [Desulfonatronovibrionaceae bacterium]
MHLCREVKPERIFMGRLERGSDLLGSLGEICLEKDIRLGRVEAIGAVERARLQYYCQDDRTYQDLALDRPMEILSLKGNVSLKQGSPLIHAHLTLAGEKGWAVGGHLAPGTMVFACEYVLEQFLGPDFSREHDQTTGLPLWTSRI